MRAHLSYFLLFTFFTNLFHIDYLSFYNFLEGLQKIGAKANKEVNEVEANPIREKRRQIYVNRENYILRKTDDLDRGAISVTEFLCSAYQDNPDLFPLPEEEGEGIADHGNLEVSLGTYFIFLINNSN